MGIEKLKLEILHQGGASSTFNYIQGILKNNSGKDLAPLLKVTIEEGQFYIGTIEFIDSIELLKLNELYQIEFTFITDKGKETYSVIDGVKLRFEGVDDTANTVLYSFTAQSFNNFKSTTSS